MTDQNTQQEPRKYKPQIARMDSKGKILDISDFILFETTEKGSIDEGKVVFSYTEYDTNAKKAKFETLKHYMNTEVARRVFTDILNCRFRKDPSNGTFLPLVNEYKGGRGGQAGHPEWEFASRHLIIRFDDQLNMGPAVIFSLSLGQGESTATGAIKPKGEPILKGNINVPLDTARVVAARVLDYISSIQTAAVTRMAVGDMLEDQKRDILKAVNALLNGEQPA